MKINLTKDPVNSTLVRLAIPMAFGIFAMYFYFIADTYFVAQLGTEALAAMSFIFPLIAGILAFVMGLGMGSSSIISRAIGEGNQDKVNRLTTDSLLLGVVISGLLLPIGLLTINPLFKLMGASDTLIVLIREYMQVWYLGIGFLIISAPGLLRHSCNRRYQNTQFNHGDWYNH